MNAAGLARYHVQVNLLGRPFLRYQRLRSELKARRRGWWKHEHLNPPLRTSARLKELISLHYLQGQHANGHGRVAWVTSGAPIEFLVALGYHLHYPENHGAVCGVRRTAEASCATAEDAGYSRDLCSYARTDIGVVLSGRTPVGKLPRPDILVCCTNICQTVLSWYRVLAEHFRVPLVLIDTPFLYGERPGEHAVTFVRRQLEEAIATAERVAGKTLTHRALTRAMHRSRDAVELWAEVMARGRRRPAPITAFDEFFHMSPIVQMRGMRETVDYYQGLLDELDGRVERGVGALKRERKRVLWDNLPIWHHLRPLNDTLSAHGVSLVASTYTNAWGELAPLIDADRPLDSMARVYVHPILNRGTGHKLETMRRMVDEYEADGVILHSDRSCKPYSIGQMDQADRLVREVGVPALLLEADHNDPRAFSAEQGATRLEAFLEMLE
ncbi:MAG: 2-hydroxyacyl-CoA dehydratase subunit D [Myxococcota bacterium]